MLPLKADVVDEWLHAELASILDRLADVPNVALLSADQAQASVPLSAP